MVYTLVDQGENIKTLTSEFLFKHVSCIQFNLWRTFGLSKDCSRSFLNHEEFLV